MRFVQTFWSKPLLTDNGDCLSNDRTGGWLTPIHFFMSWTLSSLYLHNHFDSLTIVADETGQKLLVEELGLPYKKCDILPKDFQQYHMQLWALPKLYTYGIQTEPYMHVDGDVFVRTKIGIDFLSRPLVVQNIEYNVSGCAAILSEIQKTFAFIPEQLTTSINIDNISFVNAGIIGGNNIPALRQYAELGFRFVRENISLMNKIDRLKFNLIFEQYLFYRMFEKSIPITELIRQ